MIWRSDCPGAETTLHSAICVLSNLPTRVANLQHTRVACKGHSALMHSNLRGPPPSGRASKACGRRQTEPLAAPRNKLRAPPPSELHVRRRQLRRPRRAETHRAGAPAAASPHGPPKATLLAAPRAAVPHHGPPGAGAHAGRRRRAQLRRALWRPWPHVRPPWRPRRRWPHVALLLLLLLQVGRRRPPLLHLLYLAGQLLRMLG